MRGNTLKAGLWWFPNGLFVDTVHVGVYEHRPEFDGANTAPLTKNIQIKETKHQGPSEAETIV